LVMVKTTMADGEKMQGVDLASAGDYDGMSPILHIEELITTALSALQVRNGIRDVFPEAKFLPILPVIINRSDPRGLVKEVENSTLMHLLLLSITNYEPEECPYCKVGSEAIAPKEGDNWKRLMAE